MLQTQDGSQKGWFPRHKSASFCPQEGECQVPRHHCVEQRQSLAHDGEHTRNHCAAVDVTAGTGSCLQWIQVQAQLTVASMDAHQLEARGLTATPRQRTVSDWVLMRLKILQISLARQVSMEADGDPEDSPRESKGVEGTEREIQRQKIFARFEGPGVRFQCSSTKGREHRVVVD